MPRPATPIILDEQQCADLRSLACSRTLPHRLVQRAQIVLGCADGEPGTAIAERLQLNKNTVMKWRKRYAQYGIEGLHDEQRPGRPRTHDDDRVAEVINTALQSLPAHRTHWSVRAMAAQTGVSKSTVQRWFDLFGVQPASATHVQAVQRPVLCREGPRHCRPVPPSAGQDRGAVCRRKDADTSTGPHPTDAAHGLGLRAQGMTHDYVRHGTTTLFAALDIVTGKVRSPCKRRHRHQDYLAFLRHIDKDVPEDLDIHLIVDNYATHKHATVKAWLARISHNQVENDVFHGMRGVRGMECRVASSKRLRRAGMRVFPRLFADGTANR